MTSCDGNMRSQLVLKSTKGVGGRVIKLRCCIFRKKVNGKQNISSWPPGRGNLFKTWMHSKDGSWCIKRWQQSVSPPPEMPPLPGLPNEPGTVRPPELPPMTFRAAAAARDPGRRRVCRFFSAFFNLENDSNLRSLVSKPGHKPYKSWYFGSL